VRLVACRHAAGKGDRELEAERKLGEILSGMTRHPPGPEKKDGSQKITYPPTMPQFHISKKVSARCRKLAKLPGGSYRV